VSASLQQYKPHMLDLQARCERIMICDDVRSVVEGYVTVVEEPVATGELDQQLSLAPLTINYGMLIDDSSALLTAASLS